MNFGEEVLLLEVSGFISGLVYFSLLLFGCFDFNSIKKFIIYFLFVFSVSFFKFGIFLFIALRIII